jgi:gliding motility-associated-like protein
LKRVVNILFGIFFIFNINAQDKSSVVIEPPEIILVTIDPQPNNEGAVHLYWKPSISESTIGVTGYYIFRYFKDNNHNSAPHLIDSVFAPAQNGIYDYIDMKAEAHKKSEMYDIVAFKDSANLQSKATPIYSTIFLDTVIYDTCAKTNKLIWTGCKGYDSVRYNITDLVKDTVIANITDTTFVHNIEYGTEYKYQIKGVSVDTSRISISNEVTVKTELIKDPNPALFYINTIKNNGGNVNFTVKVDSSADLLGYSLCKSYNNIDFQEINFLKKEQSDIVNFNSVKAEENTYYKVSAVNVCGDTVLYTDEVKYIQLNIKSTETDADLSWNSSFVSDNEVYTILLTVDNEQTVELERGYTDTTYNYTFSSYGSDVESFCFTIKATDAKGNISFSDMQCAVREPIINFPNAFTPNNDGLNDLFGPFSNYIKNAVVTEFKLIVYDRYGGAIFETTDINAYWRGKAYNGYTTSEGGYIYYLWFKTSQNKTYERSGTINVVFP